MADNLDLGAARFSTASMLPVSSEEANALFWRKVVENTGRAVGDWGTAIMGTSTNVAFGTFMVDYSGLGFNKTPSVDIYYVRGGSVVNLPETISYQGGVTALGMNLWFMGGTHMYVAYYPDSLNGNKFDFTVGTGRDHWGTWIYRMRGW